MSDENPQQTDAQQAQQQGPNGGETTEDLRIKAGHRQELARIEAQRDVEMARVNAQDFARMPIPLRIFFDQNLWQRATKVAEMLSMAQGFAPPHLLGKTEACFAVVSKSLTWNLDPFSVAQSTYQTPDGKVGYEGKLVQAIIEASGKLARPIGQGEYFGDWSRVVGKFKVVEKSTTSGKKYKVPEPAWNYWGDEEEGLGVRYHVWLAGQKEPLKFEFLLRSAFPRNATTWPTRPQQQLHYAAMRALGSTLCPSLIMGVPFSEGTEPTEPEMKDVTSIPTAPPPVDLEQSGVQGAGRMTEEDEARQRAHQDGGDNGAEAKAKKEEAYEINGRRLQRPSAVKNEAVLMMDQATTIDELVAAQREVFGNVEAMRKFGRDAYADEVEAHYRKREADLSGSESERPAAPEDLEGRGAENDDAEQDYGDAEEERGQDAPAAPEPQGAQTSFQAFDDE